MSNNNVKMIEDVLKNSEGIMRECVTLINATMNAAEALQPFSREAKETYGTLPKFLAATCAKLKLIPLSSFEINYPNVSVLIGDGSATDEGMFRLHDSIYKLGSLHEELRAYKCMIKTDDQREKLCKLAKEIVGSLAIFVITQFRLNEHDTHVYMGVQSYCESVGATPYDLYITLRDVMEMSGQAPYGYEAISAYRDDLLDIDPMFVGECEEANFPLDGDLCRLICEGVVTIAQARGMLLDHQRSIEEKEVKGLTPANMLNKMKLD